MKNNLILLSLVALIAVTSCGKRKDRKNSAAEDNNLAEVGFNDIMKVTEDAIKEEQLEGRAGNGFNELYSGCGTITVTPIGPSFPKAILIDFGTANCTGYDMRARRGQVEVTMTDYYRNAGSVITISPINYFVNDYKVEGTKTVTNNGRNGNGHLEFGIQVTNGKVTNPDGEHVTWNSTRTRTWVEGESTTFLTNGLSGILDDVYEITGNASGTDRNGRNYTATITSALRVQLNCRWITKGTLELQPADLMLRKLDFGNGNCDSEAKLTVGNRTWTIYMR